MHRNRNHTPFCFVQAIKLVIKVLSKTMDSTTLGPDKVGSRWLAGWTGGWVSGCMWLWLASHGQPLLRRCSSMPGCTADPLSVWRRGWKSLAPTAASALYTAVPLSAAHAHRALRLPTSCHPTVAAPPLNRCRWSWPR